MALIINEECNTNTFHQPGAEMMTANQRPYADSQYNGRRFQEALS